MPSGAVPKACITNRAKKIPKECGRKDTASLDPALDVKGVGHAALALDDRLHVVVEGSDEAVKLWEHPIPRRMSNSPSLLTKSKALVRSMTAMWRGLRCFLYFFRS